MIWHAPMSTRGNPSGTILVIFNDTPQRFISYQDQWREGDPETGGEVAPAGTFTPRRGFGKVWREQLGVRRALNAHLTLYAGLGGQLGFGSGLRLDVEVSTGVRWSL